MWPVAVPRRCLVADRWDVLAYSIGAVILVTGVQELFWVRKIINQPYVVPFLVASVLVSNRVSCLAGLIAAVLSILSYDLMLAGAGDLHFPNEIELITYTSMVFLVWMVAPRQPAAPERPDNGGGTLSLPFTRDDGADSGGGMHRNGRRYWDVLSSGSWREDVQVGAEYARVYLHWAREGLGPLPCWIVRDMITAGSYTGVEAGFIQGITTAARRRQ
jgi:hypothetical protein